MEQNHNYPNKSEQRVGDAFGKIGITVRYQHKIGPYTLDLFLPEYNACVEIYGPHHMERKRQQTDLARQKYLEELGIRVYIITAQEAHIVQEVKKLINRVVDDHSQQPKPKETASFNSMQAQMQQWMDKNPLPKVEPAKVVAAKPKPKEESFAELLDQYLPVKPKTGRNKL